MHESNGGYFELELTGAVGGWLSPTGTASVFIAPLPVASISGPETVLAGNTADFPVTLSSPCYSPVTVDYETVDGTATAGWSYVGASGSVTIDAGDSEAWIPVATCGVTGPNDEDFSVELNGATGAVVGTANTATATINSLPDQIATVAGGEDSGENAPAGGAWLSDRRAWR